MYQIFTSQCNVDSVHCSGTQWRKTLKIFLSSTTLGRHCQTAVRISLGHTTTPYILSWIFNTLMRQNGRLFADDTFKCISLNENIRILIKISLKFVPKGLINNIPALVLIMAWRRPGDKPLSEPMMVRSLTHIYMRHSASMSLENLLTHVFFFLNPGSLTHGNMLYWQGTLPSYKW